MSVELIRQERKLVGDPPAQHQQSIARGLRGGAAVLMVAAFEAFLDDMVAEGIQGVAEYRPAIVFSLLPEKMQVQNAFETLKQAMEGPKHRPSGTRAQRLPAIKIASASVARDELNPDAFSGTAGNPGKASVRELFKRVGIPDVFMLSQRRFERKWGKPVAVGFTGDKLDEIVQRRHRVAHRADALSISRQDLREAARFLRIFAEVLDIELGYHLRLVCREAR